MFSSLTTLAALLVPHRPCSGPLWFYRVGKRPPVKADLAIYSLIVGMSGQWVNVATMLINWISTVVTIRSVFANPVTYILIEHTIICILYTYNI